MGMEKGAATMENGVEVPPATPKLKLELPCDTVSLPGVYIPKSTEIGILKSNLHSMFIAA